MDKIKKIIIFVSSCAFLIFFCVFLIFFLKSNDNEVVSTNDSENLITNIEPTEDITTNEENSESINDKVRKFGPLNLEGI
ncbi:hypothetical protein [Candidatus Phytoplasma sp. AldY-WA1]|uniref:hypothetical protein n=1 Tax=Candidatus Phytoplasma sp. AldY-WA1 TaxID=2852100 RepID=UPI001CE23AA8|nr:hypothetical protein [Candidatus Phytoplasma sp. AldY-WA1]